MSWGEEVSAEEGPGEVGLGRVFLDNSVVLTVFREKRKAVARV